MTRFLVQSRVSSGNQHPYLLKSRYGKVSSVRLRDDGNIHFWALFTIMRFDNVHHRYQFIFPFKVKKLEDSFLLTITGLVEEVLLSTKDTQEMKNVYEALFAAMKSYFDTPYLDFTSGDFLRRTLP